MVNLDLKEFAEATRRMVQLSGVKKSRLMLRVRPASGRRTFVLKSTDGRTTLTTRVTHQGELKLVENIVNDFVSGCTAAQSLTPTAPNTNPHAHGHGNQAPLSTSSQGKTAGRSGGGGSSADVHTSTPSTGGKSGNKQGEKTAGASNAQQQQQSNNNNYGGKKRKGNNRR